MTLQELLPRELRQIVWDQLGVRPALSSSAEDMHRALNYEISAEELAGGEVNAYRKTLQAFIRKHGDQLSLPCDGNCYTHADGVVISCYQQLLEDTDGNPAVD